MSRILPLFSLTISRPEDLEVLNDVVLVLLAEEPDKRMLGTALFSRFPTVKISWRAKAKEDHSVFTPSCDLLKDGDTRMNPKASLTYSLITPIGVCSVYTLSCTLIGQSGACVEREKQTINHDASDCKSSHLKMKREWNHEGCGSLWRQKMREWKKKKKSDKSIWGND